MNVREALSREPASSMAMRDPLMRQDAGYRVREAVERSERRYRALTENSSDLIVVVDRRATIVYVSPSVRSIGGYEVEEVLGRRYFEFIHPGDLDAAVVSFPTILATPGKVQKLIYRYRCKDGRWVTLEAVAKNALFDPLVRGVVVNARDVSERERAERDMRVSEARFRAMFDQAAVGIIQAKTDGTVLMANGTLCAMLGYREGELGGVNTEDLTDPRDRAPSLALRARFTTRGAGDRYVIEKRYLHKDGHPVWVSVAVSLVRSDLEAADYFVAIVQDIGERKRAQEAEREAHASLVAADEAQRLTSAVLLAQQESSPDGIYVVDENQRMVSFNRRFVEIWEIQDEILASRSDEAALESVLGRLESPDEFLAGVKQLYEHRDRQTHDELRLKDGRTLERYSAPMFGADGKYYGRVFYFRDITQRKQSEETLRENEERFRGYFGVGLMGMAIISPESGILEVNDKMCEILGYERGELLRIDWASLAHPDDLPADLVQFNRMLAGDIDRYSLDRRFVRRDGATIYSSISISCVRRADRTVDYVMALVQDITERKCADETLRKALVATIEAMAATVEARDPYTAGHQRCVADLAAAIAREMGLPTDRVDGIRLGALIHDLGKVQVPAELLSKPTRLTALESALIKTHPQAGFEIVKGIRFPWPVAEMVHQHHERLDGSGYPQGLKGDEIALEARILAVADVIEAMASHRPYRPGLGIDAALAQVRENRGRWFDADAVDAALRLFGEKRYTLERPRDGAMQQPAVDLAEECR